MDIALVNKLFFRIQEAKSEEILKEIGYEVEMLYNEKRIEERDTMILYNSLMTKANELAILHLLNKIAMNSITEGMIIPEGTIKH